MNNRSNRTRRGGLVLVELLLVVGIIGMMTGIAMISYGALWGNLGFKRKAQKLVDVFQMAQEAASQSDRRYAVVLDYYGYSLQEMKEYDKSAILDDVDNIIVSGEFNERFQFDRVLFDDADELTMEAPKDDGEVSSSAIFRVGRSGWEAGAQIIILDEEGEPWTILISRIARPVQLKKGKVPILLPRDEPSIPF